MEELRSYEMRQSLLQKERDLEEFIQSIHEPCEGVEASLAGTDDYVFQ